jgi:hypothetical protein
LDQSDASKENAIKGVTFGWDSSMRVKALPVACGFEWISKTDRGIILQ